MIFIRWGRDTEARARTLACEDESIMNILLPAFGYLVVFIFYHLAIHVEERSRVVSIFQALDPV
jgi:hypothetical protein